MYEFGDGRLYWMFDCPMGYHQVEVNARSQPKLAFAGPNARLYTWRVMPFGPVNGPTIFINLMLDINQEWQQLAISKGISIDEDTNTKLIVDDVFNHAKGESNAFLYMESQLYIAARRRLSISLPKSSFFPDRVEFVGVDVGIDSNMPAKSKHELLRKWPKPVDIRAVASFICFGMWYQK